MPTQLRDSQINSQRIASLESDISTLDGRLGVTEADVAELQNDLQILEAEVQEARGDKDSLKEYIDSKGGGGGDLTDYQILNAIQSGTSVIVTVDAGRASINGTLIESGASQTLLIPSASLNTTYHISLQQTGVLTASTAIVPVSQLYLGDVAVGPSLASITVVDKRAFLTLGGGSGGGENAEVIAARNGFATLDARLDDGDARLAAVRQEVVDARGGHESLDARLNGMSLSSGSVTFIEDFHDRVHVDASRTDALIDSGGAHVAKGTVYIDEFDDASKIDSVNTSSTIVVNTAAGEVSMSRSVTSAVLATVPRTTTISSMVSLTTAELHETILAAQPYLTPAGLTLATFKYYALLGPDGRIWLFDTQNNSALSLTVLDLNGNIVLSRRSVMTVTGSTVSGSPRAYVLGTKVGACVYYGQVGASTGNIIARTFQTDFSDIASQNKTGIFTSIGSWNSVADGYIDAKVDANGRVWVAAISCISAGQSFIRYGIIEADGVTRYLDWQTGPIAGVANTMQWAPALQLLSTGEMALAWIHQTVDAARGSVYQTRCYVAIYSSAGILSRGPITVVQGAWTNSYEKLPPPAMVEVPTGTLHVFVQSATGLSRVAVKISDLSITYRKASSITEDVVPYGSETAGGTVTPAPGSVAQRTGVFIRPTANIQLADFGILFRSAASAVTPILSLYRKDGVSWTHINSVNLTLVTGSQTIVVWAKAVLTVVLEAGREYFLGLPSGATGYGPVYMDTSGGIVNYTWGQVEPGYYDGASLFTTTSYRMPMTIVIANSTTDVVNRVYFDNMHLTASYDSVAGKISLGLPLSNLTFSSAVSGAATDYANMGIVQWRVSDWNIADQFLVETAASSTVSGYALPIGSDQFWCPFMRVGATGQLYMAKVTNLSTAITYQVTADGGTTWKPIVPNGPAIDFPSGGTTLILQAAFSSPRAGATSHLLRYELQQWQASANVSLGKSYTLIAPSTGHPDSGGELTDGYLPGTATLESTWVGWQSNNPVIVMDLGLPEKLLNVRLYMASLTTSGIYFPTNIQVEGSLNNVDWAVIGTQPFSVTDTNPQSNRWFDVSIPGSPSYRYVRVTVTKHPTGSWTFVGEFQVNADRGAFASASLYSLTLPSRLPTARATITTDMTLNGGTISFWLTNDGGVTWLPATPGMPVVFDNWDGSDVRLRANLASPSGVPLPPVLRRYTIVTSDLVSASTVDRRLAAREIDFLKLGLEVQVLTGASKHRLSSTVVDTFNDIVGIDTSRSTGHQFNGANKSMRAAVPAAGATIVSTPDVVGSTPVRIFFVAEDQLNSGSITYYVSRDDGATWSEISSGALLDVSGQPSGSSVRAKAIISGDAEILGWGWGWY